MRKFSGLVLMVFLTSGLLFAGDVAHFVSLGFSPDGTRFCFGQYGRTDGDFQAYAEIYGVDVGRNRYLEGGVFKTEPSRSTAGQDAKGVFLALQNQAAAFIRSSGIDSSAQGRPLFVQSDDDAGISSVTLRDFETGASYVVNLHTLTQGSGATVKSSFYLQVERALPGAATVTKTVGLPGFQRSPVKGYRIRRIITDSSGKSLVFIIEKIQHDRNGDSTRYMVETVRF